MPRPRKHPDEWYCNHTTPKGHPCNRPAGWGTDHKGTGPCADHEPEAPPGVVVAGDTPVSEIFDPKLFDDPTASLAELARRHYSFADHAFGHEAAAYDAARVRGVGDYLFLNLDRLFTALDLWSQETERDPPKDMTREGLVSNMLKAFDIARAMRDSATKSKIADSLPKAAIAALMNEVVAIFFGAMFDELQAYGLDAGDARAIRERMRPVVKQRVAALFAAEREQKRR